MSTKKQKERKKKKREEIAKSRVLSRRNYLRKKNSEENKANILDRKFRNKLSPIVKDESKKEEIKKNKDEKIISKLEKLQEDGNDEEVIKRIDETIEKINTESFDTLNYIKLQQLNENL